MAVPAGNNLVTNTPDTNEPIRKLAFYLGMALVIILCGVLPELIYYITHVNAYLLYIIAPPAIFSALLAGSIARTFKHRAAWYWLAFFCCMIISVPFSSWRGASTGRVFDYARLNMTVLFIAGGLATTWKEIRIVFYTIAWSGILSVLSARMFAAEENGRLTLESSGSIGNSNDLAQHLVMLLPFILYVVLDKQRNFVLRCALFAPAIFYGLWVIVGTASRGALIALVVMFLFILSRASGTQRLTALVAAAFLLVGMPLLISDNARIRLKTLIGGAEHEEAKESQESRLYLFRQSIIYTLEHPIVGVGPDQFANYEGKQSVSQGKLGNWHATHCSWTQVSSECGIPALIFFTLGIGSALFAVNKVFGQAKKQGNQEIATTCLCYMVSMIGLIVALTFLSNAYRIYLPLMVGLAISLSTVAKRQMEANAQQVIPQMVALQ